MTDLRVRVTTGSDDYKGTEADLIVALDAIDTALSQVTDRVEWSFTLSSEDQVQTIREIELLGA